MSRKLVAYFSASANGAVIRDGKLMNERQSKEILTAWVSSLSV